MAECSICLCSLDDGVVLLRCNHAFHSDCIGGWMSVNPRCPNCRTPVDVIVKNYDDIHMKHYQSFAVAKPVIASGRRRRAHCVKDALYIGILVCALAQLVISVLDSAGIIRCCKIDS